jgi:hypothetical protein
LLGNGQKESCERSNPPALTTACGWIRLIFLYIFCSRRLVTAEGL